MVDSKTTLLISEEVDFILLLNIQGKIQKQSKQYSTFLFALLLNWGFSSVKRELRCYL